MEVTRASLDVSAVPPDPAGAGRYVVELARGLDACDGIDLVLVARSDDGARWRAWAPRAEVLAVAPERRPARLVWEQVRLPSLLRKAKVQVHHGPHYTMPERSPVPVVVTIHDMTLFDNPEWHERSKVVVFRRAMRVAARKAAALVAVSDDTSRRFAERFHGTAPIEVIPHGIDHDRFTTHPQDGDDEQLASVGAVAPYVLSVGTLEPRKGLPALVRAFDQLATEHPHLQLLLAGQAGWGVEEIDRAIGRARHGDRVRKLGFVPEAALPPLLRSAEVVAYPSFAEGFGLPAVEALACGAVLVTTTGSAIEELVGSAGLLVHPGDEAALAAALRRAVEDQQERRRLRAAGPQVAARFTWGRAVDAHAALYRKVASRGGSAPARPA